MIGAHISKLTAQALFFVLFARSMGAEIFGIFSGVLAVVIIATPFFAFGAGSVLVKNCSIDNTQLNEYMGNALLMALVTLIMALPALYVAQTMIFSKNAASVVFFIIFFSDFAFSKLNELASQVLQSQGKMPKVAEFTIVSAVLRVVAVASIFMLGVYDDFDYWLAGYVLSALGGACYAWIWCFYLYGRPKISFRYKEIKEGLYFSMGIASQGIYNDADKAIILRYDTKVVSGNYSAAYKIVDIAFAPVRALLAVTYVGFFKAGADGLGSAYQYALKILPVTVALGLLGFLGILIASFLAEPVLGNSFGDVKNILYYICLIPLLRSVHFVFADCFTGAGLQKVRSVVQVVFAALNLALNIIIIPIYSWQGAALVSVLCDVGLCLVFFILLNYSVKQERLVKNES